MTGTSPPGNRPASALRPRDQAARRCRPVPRWATGDYGTHLPAKREWGSGPQKARLGLGALPPNVRRSALPGQPRLSQLSTD